MGFMLDEDLNRILRDITALGGAARVSEVEATAYQLTHLAAAGHITHRGYGWLALADADPAARAAACVDGLVSCVSLLRQAGADTPGDEALIHISIPANRGTKRRSVPANVVLHREDVPRPGAERATTVVAAAARAVRCLPYDDAVAALDQAARLVEASAREDFVTEVLELVAPGSPVLAQALAIDVDPRARALWETTARLVLRRGGLLVEPGVEFPGVGEVDLLIDGFLVNELDGYAHHDDPVSFARDRNRDANALTRGSLTRRSVWTTFDPVAELAAVRDLLSVHPGPLPFAPSVPEWERTKVEQMRERARDPRNATVGARLLRGRARRGVLWPD